MASEVFLLAYLEYNAATGLSDVISEMSQFRKIWYGTLQYPDPDLKLAALAIPQFDVGVEITDQREVQAGDFVQLWLFSGSGHNPVVSEGYLDSSGKVSRLEYWGSQPSSNGIGYAEEYVGPSRIDPDRLYFGRVRRPYENGDISVTLGSLISDIEIEVMPGETIVLNDSIKVY